jgi:hypothetical protein
MDLWRFPTAREDTAVNVPRSGDVHFISGQDAPGWPSSGIRRDLTTGGDFNSSGLMLTVPALPCPDVLAATRGATELNHLR